MAERRVAQAAQGGEVKQGKWDLAATSRPVVERVVEGGEPGGGASAMGTGSFRSSVWDPWLLIAELLGLQGMFYGSLSLILAALDWTFGHRRSLHQLFRYSNFFLKGGTGAGIAFVGFLLNSLALGVGIWAVVGRAKLALDFAASAHFAHFLIRSSLPLLPQTLRLSCFYKCPATDQVDEMREETLVRVGARSQIPGASVTYPLVRSSATASLHVDPLTGDVFSAALLPLGSLDLRARAEDSHGNGATVAVRLRVTEDSALRRADSAAKPPKPSGRFRRDVRTELRFQLREDFPMARLLPRTVFLGAFERVKDAPVVKEDLTVHAIGSVELTQPLNYEAKPTVDALVIVENTQTLGDSEQADDGFVLSVSDYLCWWYNGWVSVSPSWWVVQTISVAVSTVLAEFLCIHTDSRSIPITSFASARTDL